MKTFIPKALLFLENENLRRRVEEAEGTIRAIREGEVDALVVKSPGGEKIYTLQSADQPYRFFVEAMKEGALTLTAEETIFFCNKRFSEMIQTPIEKIVGSSLRQWVGLENEELLRELFSQGKEKGAAGEICMKRGDGAIVPVHVSISPLQVDEIIVACVVVMDITSRKAEEARVESYLRKLEFSNKELENFASIASHDLQEPLRKLQVFGDLLMQESGLDQQGLDYVRRMQESARRMSVLVESLLEYSRVGTKPHPQGPVDLSKAVEAALSNLEIRIAEAGGTVNISPLPTIQGNMLQMIQLFQNLIGNAMKFHSNGRTPIVEISSRFSRDGSTGAGEYSVYVEDNGTGFDEEHRERIFLPFERLVGRMQYEGVGIGLAICKKIVERHGGTISARSTPGKGSTFTITLPERHSEE